MQKIKFLTLFISAAFTFGLMTACKTAENSNVAAVNQTVNNNTANTNQAVIAKESPKTEVAPSASFSLATPTDAYKTAHAIREKKDIAGLKKVLSKDILEFFTEMGKVDNKSLDESLQSLLDKPQAKTAEVRNEKITGDRAVLEYLDENGKWKEMDFEKEGSEWKLTMPKMDGPGTGSPANKK